MNQRQIIKHLDTTGHLRFPFGQPQRLTKPIGQYKLTDKAVVLAVESYQDFLKPQLDAITAEVHPARLSAAGQIDGEVGPVTRRLLELPRCMVPDYQANMMEAVGQGNWKRCHGIGEFHAAAVKILNNPPSFLAPLFDQVLQQVVQAYDEVGLRFYFFKPGETVTKTPHQIDFSFVSSSSGWIGLATVTNSATCQSSPIFCRYLSTYKGGNSEAAIINQWTTLIKHELGHNTGMGHSSGGVMNPSIVNNLPVSWRNDTNWSLLVQRFGGQKVIGPDIPPPPPPPNGQKFEYIASSDSPIVFKPYDPTRV